MKKGACKIVMTALAALMALAPVTAEARTKLVALPDREATVIRLDNPRATLIEEERTLTLEKGVNQVDFSWKSVAVDPDSIRLQVLGHPDRVTLLNVSYPPGEAALVWEIASQEAFEERVRISYLLSNIDRLITYKLVADKPETRADFKSFLVLRNFSGEDFQQAQVLLDYGQTFERSILHEETQQLLFLKAGPIKIEKVWTFDAAQKPWDPDELDENVGIPVSYHIENVAGEGLGVSTLWGGKVRVYQDDGHQGTIFSGEDETGLVPVGEKMEVEIGDSRDLKVTQRKMREERINLRRNKDQQVVLFDTDEEIKAEVENFKDRPAVLTMLQHIPGQWEMKDCNLKYEKKDAGTLKFRIELPPKGKQTLRMRYRRLNVRP
ncbi:MAG: hypothetical protein KKB20_26685 [Proteobacteria bacterium]|nr:hypothetical protein [Pseudomonadota bacterium]